MITDHPALRYYGGKFRLAPWIISAFPQHTCYVEPFGGAMSVLLQKPRSYIDVYNDVDKAVVTYFRVLRDRTDEFIRSIELTPFSREELRQAYAEDAADEMEIARRLYVRATQAIGGPRTQWSSGWRFMTGASRGKRSIDDTRYIEHLYVIASRLRDIYIECDDYRKIISRFDRPNTLFYCDPPYLASTRSRWSECGYMYEMTDQDHIDLAKALHAIDGMAVISGYISDLYRELYAGWEVRSCLSRTNTVRNGAGIAEEYLWISPNAQRMISQRSLFETQSAPQPELRSDLVDTTNQL